jgi:molecular chaperone DnaK (HSP70)
MEKAVVGIDLGTTYSCIAAYVDGKVEVLADYDGNKTIPSFVTFPENGDIQVGKLARENIFVDSGNRVYGKFSIFVGKPQFIFHCSPQTPNA